MLQRLSDQTGIPLADLQAAAADPAALGLPAYANGMLEGFLFPATYDIEPGTPPVGDPAEMVAGTVPVLDALQVPEARAAGGDHRGQHRAGGGRARTEDMGKVARVLDNRLADGMPLQLDTTVNYANGKSGITTTVRGPAQPLAVQHLRAPRPAAGRRSATRARRRCARCSTPTPGDWRFFVVVDPDTGETRFAVTAAEHAQNVLLFQQWLQDNPGE